LRHQERENRDDKIAGSAHGKYRLPRGRKGVIQNGSVPSAAAENVLHVRCIEQSGSFRRKLVERSKERNANLGSIG
jgi:hypothetical protein